MESGSTDGQLSLAWTEVPDDDSGSMTLARFEFQITLTAESCLSLLTDDDVSGIICEWEEDYVIERLSSFPELISVKHLEPSVGRWTLATIVNDGGIAHLFNRWRALGETATCRLRTNGGLSTGTGGAASLKLASATGVGLDTCAQSLAARIDGADEAAARRFLQVLTIEDQLPKRDDLLAKLLADTIPRACPAMGWPPDEAAIRFAAVRQVALAAATSDKQASERAIIVSGTDARTEAARLLSRKTITRERLRAVLNALPSSPATVMVQKLDRGGLGPTDVERCKRQRADWLKFESRWSTGLPGDQPLDKIRHLAQDLAFVAETQTRSAIPYAADMRQRILELAAAQPVTVGHLTLTEELLLGAAYDETDRCNIWWSDRFTAVRTGAME